MTSLGYETSHLEVFHFVYFFLWVIFSSKLQMWQLGFDFVPSTHLANLFSNCWTTQQPHVQLCQFFDPFFPIVFNLLSHFFNLCLNSCNSVSLFCDNCLCVVFILLRRHVRILWFIDTFIPAPRVSNNGGSSLAPYFEGVLDTSSSLAPSKHQLDCSWGSQAQAAKYAFFTLEPLSIGRMHVKGAASCMCQGVVSINKSCWIWLPSVWNDHISHVWKRNINFKITIWGAMLVPRKLVNG